MTFATVVFGTASVTSPGVATFTDESSISSGGFRLFIVPTVNIGGSGIDIGFTYVNQFGVTKTTAVSTAIGAGTTSGTHVEVVLEPNDTGIRDLISISYFAGGTAGDALSFQSWNEGLGAPAFSISLTDSHDRSILGSFLPETMPYEFTGNFFDISTILPDLYYQNPVMQVPLEFIGELQDLFLPEIELDRGILVKEELLQANNLPEWISEPIGLRNIIGYVFPLLKSWLESIVGQVVSGYITNTNNEIIYNAIKLVLISSTVSTQQPGGISDALNADPVTGLYQAFIKNIIYDDRYIIIQVGVGKYTSLKGGGTPTYIDGSKTLPIPYNLQFECPTIECDFDMTRKQ